MTKDLQRSESWEHAERERDIRQGIDLATTLERIEKNFVITDPRLPDNPIVRLNFLCFFAFCLVFVGQEVGHQCNINTKILNLDCFSCPNQSSC